MDVPVSSDEARRHANGYLVTNVSMTLHATDSMLVMGEQSVWRFSLAMRLPGFGTVTTLGTIEVDAQSGEVRSFSDEEIRAIQDRANAVIARLTQSTTPTN